MNSKAKCPAARESGFTLIEVMVAGLILSIGLLVLAYGYGQGLASVVTAQEDTIAREKCREALESIMTGLNNNNINFGDICNQSQGGNCLFVDGLTPIYYAGNDGIFGTADDSGPCTPPAQCGIQTYQMPGPDGILGTPDDITVSLSGTFQRKIEISNTGITNLKLITVTVQYATSSGQTRNVVVTSYASPYA